jgi:hypothetical protein
LKIIEDFALNDAVLVDEWDASGEVAEEERRVGGHGLVGVREKGTGEKKKRG